MITFKAKRKDINEDVIGYYVKTREGRHLVYPNDYDIYKTERDFLFEAFEILPETLIIHEFNIPSNSEVNFNKNLIDSAYCVGILNTSGLDVLSKELDRLKQLNVNPSDFIKFYKKENNSKKKEIIIHYDFADGTEISYDEGIKMDTGFNTCCLSFFSFDTKADDVIVVKKNKTYISRNELLLNDGKYTEKQIRKEHDIKKMLIAGSFSFKQQ